MTSDSPTIISESPFAKHRGVILGFYGAAVILQDIVLSCWSGSTYPVSLSKLAYLDDRHKPIALALIEHYAAHGENDKAFMALADDIATTRHPSDRR